MKIGGLQKFSLIDYPERISGIAFTQGCNLRCPYCHNPALVDPARFGQCIAEEEILSFFRARKGKLDAVVITGGEPCLQPDLADFATLLKEMGYLVKIDTNGSRPDVLQQLIARGVVDYFAMDVKAPLEKYAEVARTQIDTALVSKSISIIIASGVDHEFRTTIPGSLLNRQDYLKIGKLIKGCCRYVLQKMTATEFLEPGFAGAGALSPQEISSLPKALKRYAREVIIR